MKEYFFENSVEIFDKKKPWVFVHVPQRESEELAGFADRGLISIRAQVGSSAWDTSLMPMGDGTHFIPLPKKMREREGVEVGDTIRLQYRLRARKG